MPRPQEEQLSLAKLEEELKTSQQLDNRQKERENNAVYNSIDQNNLVQFYQPEHFLTWYNSIDQMGKSIPVGFETVPEKIVTRMLKGSGRQGKGRIDEHPEASNEKYLGGTNVVMITFGDLDKLPDPKQFSTAISNCERVLECMIIITTVGLDNKINERHL